MPSLRDLQKGFAAALLGSDAVRAAPGIHARGLSPALRIGFYRVNLLENYRKALAATYPAIEQLVGPELFAQLARQYTRRYPSRSADVGRHAQHFSEFLRWHACAADLPYLSDVARLEWCIEESFNEADSRPLALDRLATVAPERWESLRFTLAPGCRLLSSVFPIDFIWQACRPGADESVRIDLDCSGVSLLIRREEYAVVMERLSCAELAMLVMLDGGHSFGEAFAYARAVDASFQPGELLRRHGTNGVLAAFALPAEAFEA